MKQLLARVEPTSARSFHIAKWMLSAMSVTVTTLLVVGLEYGV